MGGLRAAGPQRWVPLSRLVLSDPTRPAVNCRLQTLAQIDVSGEQTSKRIVDRFLKILLASQVALGHQNRGMAEEELNLLRRAFIDMTQLRTCPPQVVRREMVKLYTRGTLVESVADNDLRNAGSPTPVPQGVP